MAKAQSKPSKEQAENFHVLPKADQQKEEGRKPTLAETGTGHIERDPEAGSVTGAGTSTEATQPTRESTFDRSQVS